MDYKAIINLMKEMNRTELTKLEIESDGVRINIEKAYGKSLSADITEEAASPFIQPAPAAAQKDASADDKADDKASRYKKLLSPMVGTFYAQPSPEKPPYIKVGDKVRKGQTICIIEAMKLMNEIESEYDGEVVEVLVENEDMVEFGQPLFLIN